MAESDEKRYRERLQRITGILSDIAGHAQSVSKERCPYKNKAGLCTAQFRCRNQRSPEGGGLVCGHDGKFDYRLAWETRPDTYEKTREKLRRIREEAERRRRNSNRPQDIG
jgi:hypothetical protein